jgi:hypothetical protein
MLEAYKIYEFKRKIHSTTYESFYFEALPNNKMRVLLDLSIGKFNYSSYCDNSLIDTCSVLLDDITIENLKLLYG